MPTDVSLTAAARENLASLQKTQRLQGRTQTRLSTGLKVNDAADDAIAFFQGRALGDRARDLLDTKDGIDNAVGTIKAAMEGLASVETLLVQMKGLALGAKTESDQGTRHRMYRQFAELRDQLDALANDSSFMGVNLISDPASDMSVLLSPAGIEPQSKLDINGVAISATSLGLDPETNDISTANYGSDPAMQAIFDDFATNIISMTNSGTGNAVATETYIGGLGANKALNAGGSWAATSGDDGKMSLDGEAGNPPLTADQQYRAILSLQDFLSTGGTSGDTIDDIATSSTDAAFTSANYPSVTVSLHKYPWETTTGYSDNIDHHIEKVDAAIATVRNTMAQMGGNIALLQVRQEFTKNMSNLASEGAAQLLNADLDEEGANMVALQTRSQLGLQALSFSGKSDQAVLNLF